MKTFSITLPIAGHAVVTVEAENEADAVLEAFQKVTIDDIEQWEALEQFNQGNICYCPRPWEVEVDLEDDGEE